MGIEQGVKKTVRGTVFSRGNEQSEASAATAAPTITRSKREVVPLGTTSLFIISMGIEQGVKKTVRWTVFSRGNEQSEASAATAALTITRSNEKSTDSYDRCFSFYIDGNQAHFFKDNRQKTKKP